MKNIVKIGLAFIGGMALGGYAMKKYIDHKLEEIDDYEEEQEIQEEKENNDKVEETVVSTSCDKNDMINYNSIKNIKSTSDESYQKFLDDLRYRNELERKEYIEDMTYDASNDIEFTVDDEDRDNPYPIPERCFMEIDEYESSDWTLYSDGYVTDDVGLPIPPEDVLEYAGINFETYYGLYSDDTVWIRNEKLKLDISIVKVPEEFAAIASDRNKMLAGIDDE